MSLNDTGRPIVDLIGKKFGRLTGLRFDHQGNGGLAFFEFQCDCGNKKVLCGTEVSNGRTKSCGCYKKGRCGNPKAPGQAAAHMLFVVYRYEANKRKLEFHLSEEKFLRLTKKNCTYCGIEPKQVYTGTGKKSSPYLYNGVDRIDNNMGYINTNVCPCCKVCNQAKHSMSILEFQEWVNRLVNFQLKRRKQSDACLQ